MTTTETTDAHARLVQVTAELYRAEDLRLELAAERDRLIVATGIGPRPLARLLGITVQRAQAIRNRARAARPALTEEAETAA